MVTSKAFFSHVHEVLSTSLVNGVPQIMQARTTFRRVFHIAVFVCCLTGFTYQTTEFLVMYWTYPTVVDVKVEPVKETFIPGVTFCEINMINREMWCRHNACRPVAVVRACRRFFTFCPLLSQGLRTFLLPYSNISEAFYAPQEEIVKYTFDEKGNFQAPKSNLLPPLKRKCLVANSEDNVIPYNCSDVLAPAVRSRLNNPPLCRVYNSMDGKVDQEPFKIETGSVVVFPTYRTDELFYLAGPKGPSFEVSVHSPYGYGNPYRDGMPLFPNRAYTLQINEVERRLLPKPYTTNCMDYMAKIKESGNMGPVNQKECIEQCKLNMSLSELGCALRRIWYPHSNRRCEPENQQQKLSEYHSLCTPKCGPACWERYYDVTPLVTSNIDFGSICNETHMFKSVFAGTCQFQLSFKGSTRTTFIYKPKYQFVEAISSIGGFVGIWLGISLIALFNFGEQAVMIATYPFREKRQKLTAVQPITSTPIRVRRSRTVVH